MSEMYCLRLLFKEFGKDFVLAEHILLNDLDVCLGLFEQVDLVQQELSQSH